MMVQYRKKRTRTIAREYREKKKELEESLAESGLPKERKDQLLADAYEKFFQKLCQNEARTQFVNLRRMSRDPDVDCKTKRQIAEYIIDRAHGKPKDRQVVEAEPIRIVTDIPKPKEMNIAKRAINGKDDSAVGEV